jgi:uncharacterized protein (DUF302 family)
MEGMKMSSSQRIVDAVDELEQQVASNVGRFTPVATIDHARLAFGAGVEMPPSIVTIFSDPETNAPLVATDPLIGLDLPHRVLTYAEPAATSPSIAFADAGFIAWRHDVTDIGLLARYEQVLDEALAATPVDIHRPVTAGRPDDDKGLIQLVSDYPFDETLDQLRKVVSGQGDTVWFGELDFRAEAAAIGVDVPATTMLLFGGPAPGGMCMAGFPRLGLDAFCQKLLVFEHADGRVRVAFNDIVSLATLHYGQHNQPQEVVNSRLDAAFRTATSR